MTQQIDPQDIIQLLKLTPLPFEGGMYLRTYCSEDRLPGDILPVRYRGEDRFCGTAIYFFLTDDDDSFSALHRLKTDEIYHFYLGDPVEVTLFEENGKGSSLIMGQDILAGQHLQALVPHGVWQGSRLVPGGRYALMGTTMAPGYDLADFEAADRRDMITRYPAYRDVICSLTRTTS